jgi:putative transposase
MSEEHKKVKRFHVPGDCHEFTFCCQNRLPLLSDNRWCVLLAEHLDRSVARHSSRLVAYVFMPEHVHLLVPPTTHDFGADRFLKSLKTHYSSRVKSRLMADGDPLLRHLMVRERPGVHCFRFWQEGGGYDRNIRTRKVVEAAVAYIHENPVRRRLCGRSTDWIWSSARHYGEWEDAPVIPHRSPVIHGLSWDFSQ